MRKALILLSQQNDPQQELSLGIAAALPGVMVARAHDVKEALEQIADAELLLAYSPHIPPQLVEAAHQLQWIQLLGSGLDGVLEATAANPNVLITNGRGAQAEPVSETVIAFLFALSRQLPRLVRNQAERSWERWPASLLKGSTVMIVGIGAIAECLAPKCRALGMRIVGFSSKPRQVKGFDHMHALDRLVDQVGEADYLVLLTPLSEQTRSLVNQQLLANMRKGACLINVGRGGVVDEAALVNALESGHLAGAALDVFAEEPLPQSSPLWTCPNLMISPHLGGLNTGYAKELLPILRHNIECYLGGHIGHMRNIVSRDSKIIG